MSHIYLELHRTNTHSLSITCRDDLPWVRQHEVGRLDVDATGKSLFGADAKDVQPRADV